MGGFKFQTATFKLLTATSTRMHLHEYYNKISTPSPPATALRPNSSAMPQQSQEQLQSPNGEIPLLRHAPGRPKEVRPRRRERDGNAENFSSSRQPLAPLLVQAVRSSTLEPDHIPAAPPVPSSPRSVHQVDAPLFAQNKSVTVTLKTKPNRKSSFIKKPISSKRGVQKVSAVATRNRRGLSLTCESCRRGNLDSSKRQRQSRVSDAEARTSIARGILHIQSCNGCSRPLCQSIRKLIQRCAAHAQQCQVLSCSECAACNVSRMVQIAWRSGPEVGCVHGDKLK